MWNFFVSVWPEGRYFEFMNGARSATAKGPEMKYAKAIRDISADPTIGSAAKARMILPLANPEAGRAVLRAEVGSALAMLWLSPEMIAAERAAAAAQLAGRAS